MTQPETLLKNQFTGCLLGLAVGDALGGKFEAQNDYAIRARFPSVEALIAYPKEEIWYTDDTQMAIGVAETLVGHGRIIEKHLCEAFVGNYLPSRGYGRGRGPFSTLWKMARITDLSQSSFSPAGRMATEQPCASPQSACCFATIATVYGKRRIFRLCLPIVIRWGLKALNFSRRPWPWLRKMAQFDRTAYFAEITAACKSDAFREKIVAASKVTSPEQLTALGNGIEALESVPTAIASFSLTPHSFEETIANVIFLGGDTDTIAAMAGAISGAHLARPACLEDWSTS